ncbi:XRE family transcriptional regulator [Saccharopolyspora sp. NPDC002686]|uniref:XRE family transcriptional regulator n=1 Tax=Saccharopolyspora sp. NPDC002686 TaxID=3154541 RepID=UPI00331C02E3
MTNERLRDALLSKGIDPEALADDLGVDPKTVERWISRSRTPYPKYRYKIAARVQESEQYLWPDAAPQKKAVETSGSELVEFFPHRSAVPGELWDRLLDRATNRVDILVYVGMFMTEKPALISTLKSKAANGAQVRLLFGDRDSDAVIQRSLDERIGRHTISAKIDHALAHFAPLANVPNVDVRTHGTVLYNSIYRFDDEMVINPHVYGKIASHAPAMHLRRLSAGALFSTYADSFDAVWDDARPHTW